MKTFLFSYTVTPSESYDKDGNVKRAVGLILEISTARSRQKT